VTEAKPKPNNNNMKDVSNGKSCTSSKDINSNHLTNGGWHVNEAGENCYSSPTLIWNIPMSTYADTISIVLCKTEVSTTEYSHDMDDTETQVFSGSAMFLLCLQEICRTERIINMHRSTSRKTMWRVTLVKDDGRQNYEVRDFTTFMSLVALEIGTMVTQVGKNLDHWWKPKDSSEGHSGLILASFAEQILEVQPYLNHQKFLAEQKEHEKTQSE
jgi:hypothetical protein